MATHYRTQGFIVKKTDRGEASEFLTIYTKNFGKLKILGKAIRKIKSKLRSGAQPFYLSKIEFIQGKTHKTLTDAILINNFSNLRKDLKRLAVAHRVSEVLDNLVKGQEPDKAIWELLNETFEKLNNGKPEITYYYFFWNLISILGYQPELHSCSICQKKLTSGKLYFSFEGGGVVCGACFKKARGVQEINPDIVKILRLILKKDWQTLSRLKFEPFHQELLKNISECYNKNIAKL